MLRVMPQDDWAKEQARRVAAEVRRLREPHSAQWLSDRTAELGHTVTRAVITDLENGRRKYVTTAELIVLAEALETAPVALLYPPPYNDEVDALPHNSMTKINAVQHFSGVFDPTLPDRRARGYAANLQPLVRAYKIKDLQARARNLAHMIEELRDQPFGLESYMQQLSDVTQEIKILQADDAG
jgi:hypothetical protein